MSDALIRCRGLERTYRGGTRALRGVDLDIAREAFVVLAGPSGSGKSTLLHLIGAMDQPTAGQLEVEGQDLAALGDSAAARYRLNKVGFVFQFFNLTPTLRVLDNVALPGRLAGQAAAQARARATELLDRVGLAEKASEYPDRLSGGQQQRVAIARALMNRPRLLLADEPTGALDRQTGDEVLSLMVEAAAETQATLLIATHDPGVMARGQRVVRLVDGRLATDSA
jgi:putative ABC transport system ATP-binding protein